MKDKYFLKKEKLATLLFDIVKYLLTSMGAILLFSGKHINLLSIIITLTIAAATLTAAIFITPLKEE